MVEIERGFHEREIRKGRKRGRGNERECEGENAKQRRRDKRAGNGETVGERDQESVGLRGKRNRVKYRGRRGGKGIRDSRGRER